MKMFSSMQWLMFTGILLFAFACEKDPVPPVVNPPDPTDTYEQYGTPFSNVPSNDNMVMYEVNLRAFSAGGDLQGVINRLDEIKALGVNVIWLMPIHPIGSIKSVNSPYCVRDYKAISAYPRHDGHYGLDCQSHIMG